VPDVRSLCCLILPSELLTRTDRLLSLPSRIRDSAVLAGLSGTNTDERARSTQLLWQFPDMSGMLGDQNKLNAFSKVLSHRFRLCLVCSFHLCVSSATEELESAWILAGNSPVALAPEQTVDCDTVDQGCNGGDTVTAYAYMQGAGVEAESSYPYQAGNSGSAGTCTYSASAVVAKLTGFTYATPGCTDSCANQNEALLKQNLYNVAPASICVDASTWQTYTSGILTSATGCQSAYSALDHCVQLVRTHTQPHA
jgi:hypothetical protein